MKYFIYILFGVGLFLGAYKDVEDEIPLMTTPGVILAWPLWVGFNIGDDLATKGIL